MGFFSRTLGVLILPSRIPKLAFAIALPNSRDHRIEKLKNFCYNIYEK